MSPLSDKNSANSISLAVITVTLNAERHIRFNIENVASQTQPHSHYIFDGGSSDSTCEVVKELMHDHDNLWLIEQNDNGIYNAMNEAIETVGHNYDVVALLNADDFYLSENSLATAVKSFDSSQIAVVASNVGYLVDHDQPLKRVTGYGKATLINRRFFAFGGQLAHPGMFVRSSVYREIHYKEVFDIAADYNFQIDLMLTGKLVKVLPDILVIQRMGGYSQSGWRSFFRGKYQTYIATRRILPPIASLCSVIFNVLRKIISKSG